MNNNYNQYNQYNQPNGMNQMPQNNMPNMMPQQPVQQMPQAMPGMMNMQQGNQTLPSQNNGMNDFKQKLASLDKNNVKKIIGMVCGILLILSVFLPYVSIRFLGSTSHVSIMNATDTTLFKIVFLILSVIPIVTFFFQKAKRLSYLTSGFVLSFVINTLDSADGLKNLSFGFYFMVIASIGLLVLCIMEEIPEFKEMFTSKPSIVGGTTASANVNMQVPPAMAPAAQAQPGAPVQPVVQTVEVCNFCGQPKRNPTDIVCPSCGQRY